jgi:hypothetical protein
VLHTRPLFLEPFAETVLFRSLATDAAQAHASPSERLPHKRTACFFDSPLALYPTDCESPLLSLRLSPLSLCPVFRFWDFHFLEILFCYSFLYQSPYRWSQSTPYTYFAPLTYTTFASGGGTRKDSVFICPFFVISALADCFFPSPRSPLRLCIFNLFLLLPFVH